jgi:hypothetical protein
VGADKLESGKAKPTNAASASHQCRITCLHKKRSRRRRRFKLQRKAPKTGYALNGQAGRKYSAAIT